MSKHPSDDGQSTERTGLVSNPTLVEEARLRQFVSDIVTACADRNGEPCDLALGAAILRALLASQEAAPSARAEGSGAALIAAERQRQVEAEGWTPEHDDAHDDHELLMAADCYIRKAWTTVRMDRPPSLWPWELSWWKPSDDPIRNLTKAGALIAAEIDRRQRAIGEPPEGTEPAGEGEK